MIQKLLSTTIKDIDARGIVTVVANSIGNVDIQKDRSMPGSFDKTFKEHFTRSRWFLNHDTSILLGVPLEGKQIGNDVQISGQLNLKKQIAQDTLADYQLYAEHNRSLEHSVGVDAIKHEMKGGIRNVFEWKLWEYSTLTAWGANDRTPLAGIKSIDDIAGKLDWLEMAIKKGNYTDSAFIKIEKQIGLLRSLCTQPENSTEKQQPNNWDKWNFNKLQIN